MAHEWQVIEQVFLSAQSGAVNPIIAYTSPAASTVMETYRVSGTLYPTATTVPSSGIKIDYTDENSTPQSGYVIPLQKENGVIITSINTTLQENFSIVPYTFRAIGSTLINIYTFNTVSTNYDVCLTLERLD